MQRASGAEQSIEVFRKLLLTTRNAIVAHNSGLSSDLEQHFAKIDEDLQDITSALQEVENWKKRVAQVFDEKIRSINQTNQLLQLNSHLNYSDLLLRFESVREEVHKTKREVGNFIPTFGVDWGTRKNNKANKDAGADLKKISAARRKYDKLDEKLKSCFLCVSIFPEYSIIKKRDLIYWWIGEEFVKPMEGKTAEQVGQVCFEKLVESGLINPIHNKCGNIAQGCALDPSIRSMAISIAIEKHFFAFDSQGKPTAWSSQSHFRACFTATQVKENNVRSVSPPFDDSTQLVALFNLNGQFVKFERDITYRLGNLTFLQLGRWPSFSKHHRIQVVNKDAFFEFFLALKSLRYLGLQGVFGINELPHNIHELLNLTVLDLRACHDLKRLPPTIGHLKKLTHLDVSQCYLLNYLPRDICKLEELLVLKGFVMGISKESDQADIAHLAKLKLLRKLSIDFGEKYMISGSQLNDGKGMEALRIITITWRRKHVSRTENPSCPSLTLDWLPSSLEKVDLRCFPLTDAPSELSPKNFPNLKRLYFRGGNMGNLKGLAAKQGEIWQVEILRVKYLDKMLINSVRKLPELFPRISYVEIVRCPQIHSQRGLWIRDKGSSQTNWNNIDVVEGEDEAQENLLMRRFYSNQVETFYESIETKKIVELYSRRMRQFLLGKASEIIVCLDTCGKFVMEFGYRLFVAFMCIGPVILFLLSARESIFLGLLFLGLSIVAFFAIICLNPFLLILVRWLGFRSILLGIVGLWLVPNKTVFLQQGLFILCSLKRQEIVQFLRRRMLQDYVELGYGVLLVAVFKKLGSFILSRFSTLANRMVFVRLGLLVLFSWYLFNFLTRNAYFLS